MLKIGEKFSTISNNMDLPVQFLILISAIITSSLTINVANAVPLNGRIIGGDIASISDFPWHVSIRRNVGRHSCGGALISTTKVLTAAHCLSETSVSDINVVTGSDSLAKGGEYHSVSSFVLHEQYVESNENSWRYDIAIITLSTPAEISETQSPIEIGDTVISKNAEATLSGWGIFLYPSSSVPTILQTANFSVISNTDCQRYHTLTIYEDHICAMGSFGKGICSGDSGSALVVDDKIVGIASWVRPCALEYPDVYTRVSSFYDWIVTNTEDDAA